MSHDISLSCRCCGSPVGDGDGHLLEGFDSPTYNYRLMLGYASEVSCGEERGFGWLHLKEAIDAQP